MNSARNLLSCTLLFITLYSCNKNVDVIENPDMVQPSEGATNRVNALLGTGNSTLFGSLPAGRDMPQRLIAASNLTVKYVRESVVLSIWRGKDGYVDQWLENGYKIILNINNNGTPSPFPTNLIVYEKNLRSVLDVYHPELVVIENEELNAYDPESSSSLYHTGSLANYLRELDVAIKVCQEKNLKVTNGGLTNPVISSLYQYYIRNNKPDSAQWLSQQMGGVSKDPVKVRRADTLLTAYRALPLTYVNLHWYEPMKDMNRMTGVLQVMIDYIQMRTGKKVISNETGVKTKNSNFVTNLMHEWDQANARYVIFYDSNGIGTAGAYPLTTVVGTLLANGIAFKEYKLSH